MTSSLNNNIMSLANNNNAILDNSAMNYMQISG